MFDERDGAINISIVDYGEMKELNQGEDIIHGFAGTENYMAPEVKNLAQLSKKSDIFSLAKVFEWDLGLNNDHNTKMLSDNPNDRPSLEDSLRYYVNALAKLKIPNNQSKQLMQEHKDLIDNKKHGKKLK